MRDILEVNLEQRDERAVIIGVDLGRRSGAISLMVYKRNFDYDLGNEHYIFSAKEVYNMRQILISEKEEYLTRRKQKRLSTEENLRLTKDIFLHKINYFVNQMKIRGCDRLRIAIEKPVKPLIFRDRFGKLGINPEHTFQIALYYLITEELESFGQYKQVIPIFPIQVKRFSNTRLERYLKGQKKQFIVPSRKGIKFEYLTSHEKDALSCGFLFYLKALKNKSLDIKY